MGSYGHCRGAGFKSQRNLAQTFKQTFRLGVSGAVFMFPWRRSLPERFSEQLHSYSGVFRRSWDGQDSKELRL